MRNFFLTLALVLGFNPSISTLLAQSGSKLVKLDAQWAVRSNPQTGKLSNNLNITPIRPDQTWFDSKVVQGTPRIELIRLIERKADADRPIKVRIKRVGDAVVVLEPAEEPKAGAKYYLFVESGADGTPGIVLRDGGTTLHYQNPTPVRVADTDSLPPGGRKIGTEDQKFDPKGALALLTGSGGGTVASGKLNVAVTEVFWDNWFVMFEGKADVAIQTRDFAKSFNSIEAELDVVGILPEKAELPIFGRGSRQVKFYGKFESDRAFETIDMGGGIGLWLTMDNLVTRGINSALFLHGEDKSAPAPSPAIHVGYEWMADVSTGADESERVAKVGANRAVGSLNWPFWIARGIDLTGTPLGTWYSVRGEVDVGGTWDVESSRFLPENRFTLEIMPDDPAHYGDPDFKKPSFIFTYINGKASPTFRDVDEFLAGFSLPW